MPGVMCCKSNFKSVLHNRGKGHKLYFLQCFEDHTAWWVHMMLGTKQLKNLGTTSARLRAELKLVINPDCINIYIIFSVLVCG
jgi:hypothetical protein